MFEELFETPLWRTRACGIHPLQKRNIPLTILNCSTAIFIAVLIVMRIISDPDIREAEVWMAFTMMSVRYVTLVQKKDVLEDLFKDLESFWPLDLKDDKITYLLTYQKWLVRSWNAMFKVGVGLYWIKPIFLNGSLFYCYVPRQIPYPCIYVVEAYSMFIGANGYIGFNLIVTSFIILITIQFRQINTKIQELDMEQMRSEEDWEYCHETLKMCIRHHNFLIRVVDKLNNILYFTVGFLIGATVMLMCMHMYTLLAIKLSTMDIMRLIITFSAQFFEFMLGYGLSAQRMTDEAENMANALYSRSWYAAPTRIKRTMGLMIMRSQMVVCISVKNLLVVNNQTFLMMLKTAYSFYTFLRTMT